MPVPPTAVLRSHPLRWQAGRPIPCPTLDWLVDPTLHRLVADLERRGGVRDAERWVLAEPGRLAAVRDAHQRYANRRQCLLDAADWATLRAHGLEGCFNGLGVAGIRAASNGVKCLHAHLAHHLVEGNPVGAWVQERLGPTGSRSATAPAGSARSASVRL